MTADTWHRCSSKLQVLQQELATSVPRTREVSTRLPNSFQHWLRGVTNPHRHHLRHSLHPTLYYVRCFQRIEWKHAMSLQFDEKRRATYVTMRIVPEMAARPLRRTEPGRSPPSLHLCALHWANTCCAWWEGAGADESNAKVHLAADAQVDVSRLGLLGQPMIFAHLTPQPQLL